MIKLLVRGFLHSEMVAAKRKAGAVGILLLAATFLGIAVVFALVALYLWLATMLPDWQAAGIVALAMLLIGIAFWLAGRSRLQHRGPERQEFRAMAAQAPPPQGSEVAPGLGGVVAAAALGVIIGRILTK